MIKLLPIILFILLGKNLFAQEKLNFTDANGRKQGHWIFYGKDMPNSGIPANGKVQEGNYVDDRKEGTWIKYELDGKTPKATGEFKNNRPQSNCTWYWSSEEIEDTVKTSQNGTADTLNFTDDKGRKQGKWIVYGQERPKELKESSPPFTGYYVAYTYITDASGKKVDSLKLQEGNYVDDRKEGTWIKYHEDGKTPKLIGEYENNHPKGKYIKFWPNGKIRETGNYEKNKSLDSLHRFYENGQLEYEAWFNQDGKEDGRVNFYHPNGQLEFTYVAKNGVPYDAYHYDARGKQISFQSEPSVCGPTSMPKTEPTTGDCRPPTQIQGEPNTNGIPFKKESYNKIYNGDNEIWQDGIFKNGQLWDGKEYVYDRDGILLKVRIYKEGKHIYDGQL